MYRKHKVILRAARAKIIKSNSNHSHVHASGAYALILNVLFQLTLPVTVRGRHCQDPHFTD